MKIRQAAAGFKTTICDVAIALALLISLYGGYEVGLTNAGTVPNMALPVKFTITAAGSRIRRSVRKVKTMPASGATVAQRRFADIDKSTFENLKSSPGCITPGAISQYRATRG